MARGGDADAVGRMLLELATADAATAAAALEGLARGWPKGKVAAFDAVDAEALERLLAKATQDFFTILQGSVYDTSLQYTNLY